jgi:hypothetical protein
MFSRNASILTKQTMTSCFVTEKFRSVNFPSHDRVCDDRIIHLNHQRSLIVMSTKVNNLPFCKFPQERRCHGSVKMTVSERWVWFRMEWLTRPLQTTLRITISRLMIRLRQTGRTNDRSRNGRSRVTSQHQERHLRHSYLLNRIVMAEDTARRTPGLRSIS